MSRARPARVAGAEGVDAAARGNNYVFLTDPLKKRDSNAKKNWRPRARLPFREPFSTPMRRPFRGGGPLRRFSLPLTMSQAGAGSPGRGATVRTPGVHGPSRARLSSPSPEPEWGAFCLPRERGLFWSLCPTGEGRREQVAGGRRPNAHSFHNRHSLPIRELPQDIGLGSKMTKSCFQKIFTVGGK